MEDRVYTVARLAEHWSCSETFVRDEIKRGRLEAHRFGAKLIRIRPEAVATYEASAASAVQPLATPPVGANSPDSPSMDVCSRILD
jgi:excisionase family DNA binding protein